jgi:hypothetical protein
MIMWNKIFLFHLCLLLHYYKKKRKKEVNKKLECLTNKFRIIFNDGRTPEQPAHYAIEEHYVQ